MTMATTASTTMDYDHDDDADAGAGEDANQTKNLPQTNKVRGKIVDLQCGVKKR